MKIKMLLLVMLAFLMDRSQAQNKEARIKIQLSKSVFSDAFLVIFKTDGAEEINDQDAPKVSEGYISVAGVSIRNTKLAIEERVYPQKDLEMPLFVKGYSSGDYTLNIDGTSTEKDGPAVSLYDKLLDKKTAITPQNHTYTFSIDTAEATSQGAKRFSLLFNPVSSKPETVVVEERMKAFPNPCLDKLYLNVGNITASEGEVLIRDILGRVHWRKQFKEVKPNELLELACQQLTAGIYLVEWSSHQQTRPRKTFKIIKL